VIDVPKVKEGGATISLAKGVFYNPEMHFCRDASSLAAGAISAETPLHILDAMCASGIRGIRYAKENANIASTTFLDSNKAAVKLAKANAKANKLRKAKVVDDEVNRFLYSSAEPDFNFIELDPFGTPAPFLHAACYAMRRQPRAYLSITATDTAVLCGAHAKACLKNYQAQPLDNEYCHEVAGRILLSKLARTAADFNFGIAPLFTLSKLHYIKAIVKLEQSAEHAANSMQTLGYISHCPACLNREWREGTPAHDSCTRCKGPYLHAGPLWLGALWDAGTVEKMQALNSERNYGNKKELTQLLLTVADELSLPPTYFDLHKISQKLKISAVPVDKAVEQLKSKGFSVSRTHFRQNSIRTNAKISDVEAAVKKALSQGARQSAPSR